MLIKGGTDHNKTQQSVNYVYIIWEVLFQKQVSRAGTSNYIPQILWDVITCPCPWYLLLAQHSSYFLNYSRVSPYQDGVMLWKPSPYHGSSVNSHHKGAAMRLWDGFCGVDLNNLWNKRSKCRWFETPRRLCDVTIMRVHMAPNNDGWHFCHCSRLCNAYVTVQRLLYSKKLLNNDFDNCILYAWLSTFDLHTRQCIPDYVLLSAKKVVRTILHNDVTARTRMIYDIDFLCGS